MRDSVHPSRIQSARVFQPALESLPYVTFFPFPLPATRISSANMEAGDRFRDSWSSRPSTAGSASPITKRGWSFGVHHWNNSWLPNFPSFPLFCLSPSSLSLFFSSLLVHVLETMYPRLALNSLTKLASNSGVLLPQTTKGYNYRHAPPCPAYGGPLFMGLFISETSSL